MYLMVRLVMSDFKTDAGIIDDYDFVLKLWESESVLILPSQCFFAKGFVRVVTCISRENADDFISRITRFLKELTF